MRLSKGTDDLQHRIATSAKFDVGLWRYAYPDLVEEYLER